MVSSFWEVIQGGSFSQDRSLHQAGLSLEYYFHCKSKRMRVIWIITQLIILSVDVLTADSMTMFIKKDFMLLRKQIIK